jgi:membrane protein implicated in regulation of membrane protease activity
MVVFLFVLVLLAIAGLLGVVLKVAVLIVGTAVLAAAVLAVFAWYWFRHQLTKAQRALDRHATDIRVGDIRRSSGDVGAPERDDRY